MAPGLRPAVSAPAVILLCHVWPQILTVGVIHSAASSRGLSPREACPPAAGVVCVHLLFTGGYSTRPRLAGKPWSHFSCLQLTRPGDGRDTRQHVCADALRGVDYCHGMAPMGLIFKVGTALTLNVFLLNCRKLFVGGLDWSTTQGRCCSRLPRAAGGLNLGLQVM